MIETTKECDEATLLVDGEELPIVDISFGLDDSEMEDMEINEYMVGPREFEMTVEGEMSFDNEDEVVQHFIDMGYTVVRKMDGSIIGVVDGITIEDDDG